MNQCINEGVRGKGEREKRNRRTKGKELGDEEKVGRGERNSGAGKKLKLWG